MRHAWRAALGAALLMAPAPAGAAGDRAESSFAVETLPEGGVQTTVVNTTYRVTGTFIPGRPQDEQFVIRQRIETVQVQDEKGSRSTVVRADVWRLGDDMAAPPLYTVEQLGADDARLFRAEYYVVQGENTDWPYAPETAYRLADGARMFEASVPWATVQTLADGPPTRHAVFATANLEAVAARAAEPGQAVGILTYATSGEVVQRIEIDAADENLRYALGAVEETPAVSWQASGGGPLGPYDMVEVAGDTGVELVLSFPFNGLSLAIPLIDDRLAVEQATVPAGLALRLLAAP